MPDHGERLRIDIATRTILKLVAVAAAIWLLTQLWYVLVLITIALVLVGTLNPMVVWLEGRGVPRTVALIIIFVGMLGTLFLIGLVTIPPLVSQLADAMGKAP